MTDLITSLDLLAATGTLLFLARAVVEYSHLNDTFSFVERFEKRSLWSQKIARR